MAILLAISLIKSAFLPPNSIVKYLLKKFNKSMSSSTITCLFHQIKLPSELMKT